ncbi:LpqB family beta-propeller domain-containing protein [Leekyejoonella antrihumi]|nr:LpqB family beta-propeller domain-containing protein [Leekyejoonella antrihumi]
MLLALLVVAVLAGCAGLPTRSGVKAEQAISSSPVESPPNVFPNPPQPGEGPRELVGDFLKANASPDEDYRVARLYLTSAASNTWNPTGRSTTVTTGEQDYNIVETYDGPVQVTGRALATLDSNGHLTQLRTHEKIQSGFHLAKVKGQWRIARLPRDFGSWMSLSDFNRLFVSRQVYFADTSTHALVPDTRWYLTRGGEATALARAVLGGVPSWMTGMAYRSMPPGTRLEVDAVPVDNNGLAQVDLSQQALQADSTTRRAVWAAMIQTLDQLPQVRNVELTVGGSPLAVGTSSEDITDISALGYQSHTPTNGPILIRNGDTLSWGNPLNTVGSPGPIKPLPEARASLPTLNHNWYMLAAGPVGRQLAAISGDRKSLGRWINGKLSVQSFGTGLTQPTFTPFGELWVAGRPLSETGPAPSQNGGAVWVIDTALPAARAQPQVVSTPWLGSSQVVAMKASAEGERMAMVVQTPTGSTRLLLSAIVRNAKGVPVALSTPQQEGLPITGMTDVTWLDPATVAVLGIDPTSPVLQPITVPLGGVSTPLGLAPGAQFIVGQGAGLSNVYIMTNKQTVLERSGQRWQVFGTGSAIVVPGA